MANIFLFYVEQTFGTFTHNCMSSQLKGLVAKSITLGSNELLVYIGVQIPVIDHLTPSH